jgi:hypothetical protein
MDADLVADLRFELAEMLGDAFCVDVGMMQEAVRQRGSFNLIHFDTAFKVDVFVAEPREFDRAQLARRRSTRLSTDPRHQAFVASGENVVLAKLEWYRAGDEVSDLQWRDVLGILMMQEDRLDRGYMQRMATALGVSDLLDRAFLEA